VLGKQIWGFPFNILQRLKLATSNFLHSFGLPKSIKKSNPKKKVGAALGSEAPQSFGFPYNISATAVSSDFKFWTMMGFAKSHHKIPPQRKSVRGLVL